MINSELSQIFDQMADFLEMKEIDFRSRAYRKAARFLGSLEEDLADVYKRGGIKALKELPGIGESLAKKIEQFIKTGKIKSYQRLKKQCPVDLEGLKKVEGLASRKIKVLYQKLKVRNLKDLERAAKTGKIRGLEGFGEKSEKNILESIAIAKASKERLLLGVVLPLARNILERLEKLPEVGKISAAGSLRRMKETIGDIDILITSSKPKKVMEFFVKMPEVTRVWARGLTKTLVRLKIAGVGGLDCDLRVVKPASFGSALQYFTGNKDHNIALRKIAIKKGCKLNEYGLFRGKKQLAGRTEKKIYQQLGLACPEPELRTNTGEIEAALKPNGLPKLIDYDDMKGDCHSHTNWSDGVATIEQMAEAAKKKGYQYLAVTDHTKDLKMAHGLDEKRLLKQAREIDKLNSKLKNFTILKSCELNIRADGSLDIKDEILAKLDLVLASVHSRFKLSASEMTKRIIRAIENPNVDIIGHPTGRLLLKREPYALDFDKILKAAKRTKTALEMNAFPERLDLNDKHIRQAVEAGVKLVINTDAHWPGGLSVMELGIAQARRGWAKKGDVLNTRPLRRFLDYFK